MQSVKYLMIVAVCSTAGSLQAAPTTDLPPAPQPTVQVPVAAPKPQAAPQVPVSVPVVPPVTTESMPGSRLPAAAPQPEEEKSAEITMQEFIQNQVEEDYEHQAAMRRLNNQVEVEKKLSEIRKLRGEDKIKPSQPVSAQPKAAPEETKPEKAASPAVPPPHVVLESVIGGLSRVAIVNNSGSQLLYVKPGDSFVMDGQNYRLIRDTRLGLQIKDAAQ